MSEDANEVGPVIEYLQTSEEARGATIMKLNNPPGQGPAAHSHANMEESFYVLEGQYEFRIGEESVRAGPGTLVFVPPGTAHSFRNVGPIMAQTLCICSPPGIERFFQELETYGWPAKWPPADVLGRLRAEFGITHIG